MSKTAQKAHIARAYDVGYGKPPIQGKFQKGKSGNPNGRPRKEPQRKPAAKPRLDVATRDLFLQFAERLVSGRGSDGDVRMTAEEAVMHSLLSAAVKGSSHAQKNFLDRLDRHRAEKAAEIAEEHEFWRNYSETYSKAVESMRKAGQSMPDDLIHPDDLIFKDGEHVMLRGGADALEVKRNQDYVIGFRDMLMLQSIKDERSLRGPLKDKPLFLSHLLGSLANMRLPKRMQLDDTRYLHRHLQNGALRTPELKRQLRDGWTALGHPEWADILTSPLRHDALDRLRAFSWKSGSARPDE